MSDLPSDPPLARHDDAVENYRNVAAIVLALMIMQAGTGAMSVVAPLTLLSYGASALTIGIVVSAYAFGFMLGALFAPREIMRIGHIRAICAFAAVASLCVAGLYASDATAWWVTLEFILGLCVAGMFATGESWIADACPRERRGAILGFYLVAAKLGVIAGPFLVAAVPPGQAAAFLIVAALFTASLIPVSATRRAQPLPPTAHPFGPWRVWNVAPSAIIAALASGMVSGSVVQLYAVFIGGIAAGPVAQTAALFNAAMIGGSVILQWPAGLISDRMDRRMVIAALALLAGICAFFLAFLATTIPPFALFALAGLWGAGALSYYGIAVAHAADRAAEGEATSMMSGILMVWAIGSMIGPLAASAVMTVMGGPGLFLFAGVVLLVLAAAMVIRRTGKAPVARTAKSDFEPTSTTSVSVIELTEVAEEEAELHEARESEDIDDRML